MDIIVEDAVVDELTNRVNSGLTFTAFDITQAVRRQGHHVMHDDIRKLVHRVYEQGAMTGYDRSLQDVAGNGVRAYVYSPVTPVPVTQSPSPAVSMPQSSVPASQPAVADVVVVGTITVDDFKGLPIASDLLKKLAVQ